MIHGFTQGLAASELRAAERIAKRRVPLNKLFTPELLRSLVEFSASTGRQVGVLVNRKGQVEWVIIGNHERLELPEIGRMRAGAGRLRGLRLIHTHLDESGLSRDDIVDLTRLRLDLVCAICLNSKGQASSVYYAHNLALPSGADFYAHRSYGPLSIAEAESIDPTPIIEEIEEALALAARARPVRGQRRAILVHVSAKRELSDPDWMLDELAELARTAGIEAVARFAQIRDALDPKYLVGRGKLDEIVIESMRLDADLLIFDRNLSPSQGVSIAQATQLHVIDRTQLILEIFAKHAEGRDGKLQVELAQLKYLLPRLGAKDDALSRITGGIGGRGPGETLVEIGKRRVRERIRHLEAELKRLVVQRRERRRQRLRHQIPIVSIVGYTNVGKSTLLNALTHSDTLVADKLFATLDTRSRRLKLPGGEEVIVTDTVGFIRDLPEELFSAFRATFEEIEDASLILHVADISAPSLSEQIQATQSLLIKLGLGHKPTLLVLNKADRVPQEEAECIALAKGGIAVSALHPQSLKPLIEKIQEMLFENKYRPFFPLEGDEATTFYQHLSTG
ncbi:MAG: GTPase HflX [Sandaracinaceae bacterium]|nr:GTPase HflX [Sandaracinaceae bacterium]